MAFEKVMGSCMLLERLEGIAMLLAAIQCEVEFVLVTEMPLPILNRVVNDHVANVASMPQLMLYEHLLKIPIYS